MTFEEMAAAQTIEDIPEVLRIAYALANLIRLGKIPAPPTVREAATLIEQLKDVAHRMDHHAHVIWPAKKKLPKKPKLSFKAQVLLAMCDYHAAVEDMRHAEEMYKRQHRNVRRLFPKMTEAKAFAHSVVTFDDMRQRGINVTRAGKSKRV